MITLNRKDSLETAELLFKKEFHAIPVVENNKLTGIVTITDLINYLLEKL